MCKLDSNAKSFRLSFTDYNFTCTLHAYSINLLASESEAVRGASEIIIFGIRQFFNFICLMQHSHSVLQSGYLTQSLWKWSYLLYLHFCRYTFSHIDVGRLQQMLNAKAKTTGQESLWNCLGVEAFVSLSSRCFSIWSLIRTAKGETKIFLQKVLLRCCLFEWRRILN